MEFKNLKVPTEMTKDEEINIIASFVALLPEDSYLSSILKGIPAHCENEIRNDWGIPVLETIADLQKNVTTAEAEAAAKDADECKQRAETDIAALQDKIRALRAERDDLQEALKIEAGNYGNAKLEIAGLEMKQQELKAYAWDQYQQIEKLERQAARAK